MWKFNSAPDSATTSNDQPPMVPGDSILPMDLIGEILARLPMKSILRCKCVCKAWNALIMEPQVAKKQHRTTDTSRHHVLVASVEQANTVSLVDYSLQSLLSSSSSPPTFSKLDLRFKGDFFNPCFTPLVGECHGMLYFTTTVYNNHILFNPFTRKFKKLPFLECLSNAFGFGYDHISDSYKVVAVSSHCYGGGHAAIHTLGTDSWRRFNPKFPALLPMDRCGRFVSGTLNWLTVSSIISLDLGTETFQLLLLPNGIAGGAIGVLKGRLCIVHRHSECAVSVWVMKDYGNRESWIKLLSVPCILKYPEDSFSTTPRPLWISDEGDEILLHEFAIFLVHNSLVVHNSKSGTSKSHSIKHGINPRGNFAFVLFYDQSLISPCF